MTMKRINSIKTVQHYIAHYNLSQSFNEDLINNLHVFEFPPYSQIYQEGDEQHYFYLLVEGQIQCQHYHADGKLAVIAVQDPFAAIGDIEILRDEPLQSTVITTRKSILLGITRDMVQHYGADDPRFLRFLIENLRAKLYDTNNIQMSHVLPLIKRLAVYMLAQISQSQSDSITLPDKESLASLLGTTTRHLNRVIKQLVEQKIMTASFPRVSILNRQALEELTH